MLDVHQNSQELSCMLTCEMIVPTALLFTQITVQCKENYDFLIPSLYIDWQFGQAAKQSRQPHHHVYIGTVHLDNLHVG